MKKIKFIIQDDARYPCPKVYKFKQPPSNSVLKASAKTDTQIVRQRDEAVK